MTRAWIISVVAVGLLVLFGGLFYWYGTLVAAVGSLNIYSGSAEVVRGGTSEFGKTGSPVRLKDAVHVGEGSRVSIILKDGSVIRLEAGSEVEVASIEYGGGKMRNALFRLTVGRLWSHVEPLESGGSFTVETPTVVASVRGTEFNISYLNAQSDLYVESDVVFLALKITPRNGKEVKKGELFRIRDAFAAEDFEIGAVLAPPEYGDDWIRFNQAEDKNILGALDGEVDAKPEGAVPGREEPAKIPRGPVELAPPLPGGKALPKPGGGVSQPQAQDVPQLLNVSPLERKVLQLIVAPIQAIAPGGQPLKFTVVAEYSDGGKEDVSEKAEWSQLPALGFFDSFGNFWPQSPGSTTVTASFGGATSNVVSVSVWVVQPKKLLRLDVSYVKNQSAGVAYKFPTVQFKAVAQFSDTTTEEVTLKTAWSVQPDGSAQGSIDGAGLYLPRSAGNDIVVASYEGQVVPTTIQIP